MQGLSPKLKTILANYIFPILKTKDLKYYWTPYKSFLACLVQRKNEIFDLFLEFFDKSWPIRHPARICLYIELIESVF